MTIGPALRVMDQCIGQQSMYPLNDFPGIALGNVMDPGLLWYLPALVLWRCLGWAFLPLLPGPRLVVSVAVMAWGGYHHLHGDLKWVNQALSLFPVFVMGQLFAGKQVRDRLPPHGAMSVVIGVCYLLVCLGIETGPQYDRWNVSYVYEEKYKTNPDVEIPWLWIRGLAALSYKLSKALAVLYLIVPPQCCFMTQAGQGSLYTYVLHWRIATVLPFRLVTISGPASLEPHGFMFQLLLWFGALLYAVAVTLFTTSRPVRFLFWPIVEPSWLNSLTLDSASTNIPKGK